MLSGQDRKWEEFSQVLQHAPQMREASGRQRKLIVFTEHRDTLNYLYQKIGGVLGNLAAVISIHGGTHRDVSGGAYRRCSAMILKFASWSRPMPPVKV